MTQVPLLADTPAEENQEVINAAAQLIQSAVSGSLVAVVCKHQETLEPTTILCAMFESEEGSGTAQYIPLGMLFTPGNTPWIEYIPPQSALAKEETSGEGDQPASEEAS